MQLLPLACRLHLQQLYEKGGERNIRLKASSLVSFSFTVVFANAMSSNKVQHDPKEEFKVPDPNILSSMSKFYTKVNGVFSFFILRFSKSCYQIVKKKLETFQ